MGKSPHIFSLRNVTPQVDRDGGSRLAVEAPGTASSAAEIKPHWQCTAPRGRGLCHFELLRLKSIPRQGNGGQRRVQPSTIIWYALSRWVGLTRLSDRNRFQCGRT